MEDKELYYYEIYDYRRKLIWATTIISSLVCIALLLWGPKDDEDTFFSMYRYLFTIFAGAASLLLAFVIYMIITFIAAFKTTESIVNATDSGTSIYFPNGIINAMQSVDAFISMLGSIVFVFIFLKLAIAIALLCFFYIFYFFTFPFTTLFYAVRKKKGLDTVAGKFLTILSFVLLIIVSIIASILNGGFMPTLS